MKIEGGLDSSQSDLNEPARGGRGRFVLLRHHFASDKIMYARKDAGSTQDEGGDRRPALPTREAPSPLPQVSRPQASHWDLMLEQGDRLRTFQLFEFPLYRPDGPRQVLQAKRIADHRPVYLNYEGEVSGNRGAVRRVCWGIYRSEPRDAFRERILLACEHPLGTLDIPSCAVGEDIQLEVLSWAIRTPVEA